MNTDKFTNILMATMVVMQLVSVLIVVTLWGRLGNKSLIPSCILAFILSLLALRAVMRIKVYDEQGKPVKKLSDMFGDIIAAVVWTAIGSVLSVLAGMFLANHYAKGEGKLAGFIAPILGVASFYGALVVQAKVCQ